MLRVGIDICDDYTQVACYDPRTMEAESIGLMEEEASSWCRRWSAKKKGADSWFIGEEAYRCALYGRGTMVDKLVKLAQKGGTATIEGIRYTAEDLMKILIRQILKLPLPESRRRRSGRWSFPSRKKTMHYGNGHDGDG
ncbi:MAG: hypothetical protein V8S96_09180 [Lachnospiraceae bacterium]